MFRDRRPCARRVGASDDHAPLTREYNMMRSNHLTKSALAGFSLALILGACSSTNDNPGTGTGGTSSSHGGTTGTGGSGTAGTTGQAGTSGQAGTTGSGGGGTTGGGGSSVAGTTGSGGGGASGTAGTT